MYKALIVDRAREGREQIRYLLEQGELAFEIRTASSAPEALDLLGEGEADILMTDVEEAEELVAPARKRFPSLPILIFCSYEDFARAERQETHGGVHCCLKPAEGERLFSLLEELLPREQEGRERFLARNRHLLHAYLYARRASLPEEADLSLWKNWHRAILIESAQPFFDSPTSDFAGKLQSELHRPFFYLNLNAKQSLLLFNEVYCDYTLIGKHIYFYLKRRNAARFFVAVSRQFSSYEELPEILRQLDDQMGEHFDHPDVHVFTSEEEKARFVSEEAEDSELIQLISEDISRKDVGLLKKHFGVLVDKYQKQSQFSAMYVKFVFSSVLQELFQEPAFAAELHLEKQIDELYSFSDMGRILSLTREAISDYELFLERSRQRSREKVRFCADYVKEHLQEDLTVDSLAQKVRISPGYLHYLFRKEMGDSVPGYQHTQRLIRARELLEERRTLLYACHAVGFINTNYFVDSYLVYYGALPGEKPGESHA